MPWSADGFARCHDSYPKLHLCISIAPGSGRDRRMPLAYGDMKTEVFRHTTRRGPRVPLYGEAARAGFYAAFTDAVTGVRCDSINWPPFIIASSLLRSRSTPISRLGSPLTTSRSAILPSWIVQVRSGKLNRPAPLYVAQRMTSSGEAPANLT